MTERLRHRVQARIASYDRRDVIRWTLTVVVVLLVVPFVVFAVPQVVGAEHSYVVLSGSMEPAIGAGDVVIVEEVAPAEISEGDVITFVGSQGEPPTTHRVVAIDESGDQRVFLTKGDSNENVDSSPVPADSVAGRVMEPDLPVVGSTLFVIPYIGHVIAFVNTTVGFVSLVVVPIGLLIATELWSAIGRYRNRGDEAKSESSPAAEPPEDELRDETSDEAGISDEAGASHEAGTADGDGSTDEGSSDAADEESTDDDEALLTLTPRQAAAGAVLFGSLAAVAGWRVLVTQRPISAVVAGGSAVSALLLVAVVAASRGTDPADDAPPDSAGDPPDGGLGNDAGKSTDVAAPDTPAAETDRYEGDSAGTATAGGDRTVRIVHGSARDTLARHGRARTASIDTLVDMAAERDTRIVRDTTADQYVLPTEDAVYVATGDRDPANDVADPVDLADEGRETVDPPDLPESVGESAPDWTPDPTEKRSNGRPSVPNGSAGREDDPEWTFGAPEDIGGDDPN